MFANNKPDHEHNLHEFLEVAADMVDQGDDEVHLPFMVLDCEDGTSVPVIFPMPPKNVRHDLMHKLGASLADMFKDEKALKQIWLCSDTWVGKAPTEGDFPPNYSPADDPQGVEAIMVSRLTRDGYCEMALRTYEKEVTLDGRHVKWGEVDVQISEPGKEIKPYLLQEIFDGYNEAVA